MSAIGQFPGRGVARRLTNAGATVGQGTIGWTRPSPSSTSSIINCYFSSETEAIKRASIASLLADEEAKLAKIPKTKTDLELFDPFAPMCRAHFDPFLRFGVHPPALNLTAGEDKNLVLRALANSLVLGNLLPMPSRISSSDFASETIGSSITRDIGHGFEVSAFRIGRNIKLPYIRSGCYRGLTIHP